MDIGDWLNRDAVGFRSSAANKRQALAAAAEIGARALDLDAGEILEALMEREQEGSTGVGQGVAVPHARLRGLDRMQAVFVRLDAPVAFDAVDDKPVDLIFALFAPADAGPEHLLALARASRLLRKAEVRERLRQAHSADAIYALLVQETESSAA